ncbi:MAG: DUF885 domain-containing protein [Novosphingobium sp.]|nr:DUF885 domain-containing protein [Novosphingobium sp.]
MKHLLSTAAALALTACAAATLPPETAASAPASRADQQFATLAARYIASLTRLSPVEATGLGEHRYDDRLPDITAGGRAARETEWRAILGELAHVDRSRLSRDNQVDFALLDNELRYKLWSNDRLQEWAWDTQGYNDTAGSALYRLAARDFAPWPVRLRSATARMEALPGFFAETRRQLVPARVPKIWAETLARQNPGIVQIVEDMLVPQAGALTGAERTRFDAALAGLKTAVAEHQRWIDGTLVPQARGEARLGAQVYDEKMRFALQSDLTRPELKARALAAKAEARAEMYRLAREVLAGRAGAPPLPAEPSASQQQAGIEAALALSYAVRPNRDRLEQRARETLAQATEFVRRKGFIRMPDGPVKIITMPKFQQGFAVAYDDAPGALERNLDNFYAVSPIPEEWSDAQATSFLSEYNDYMIHDLSVHEAVPGHYLQLDHASRDPSVLRAVLGSGPFVEGWAVYSERLMAEHDYLGADTLDGRLYKLTVLKMRLRSITNTLLDIGFHTEGLTREGAMELMTQGAFQQEREAAGKWTRANLSSVQLLSYFTGYAEHMALRDEARARWGKNFDLRKYNDAVLSHGSPPVRYVRALMFGLPVG